MAARTDVSRIDFVVGATLPSTGTQLLGTNGQTAQSAVGTVINAPFSVQELLGFNHLSLTFVVTGTATGAIAVQGTDFGGQYSSDVFGIPAANWANLNYPGTATAITLALAGSATTAIIGIPNIATKFIRLNYTATSGTGTVSVALTARANSRT